MIDRRKALDAPPAVQLFRLLITLGLHLRARMDRHYADLGLTTQQAALLTLAGTDPQGGTLRELAAALSCSYQNIGQLVDALQKKGLVTVDLDPSDRRARRVRCTAAVKALFKDRDEEDARLVRSWFVALSNEEVETAVALLRRLARDPTREEGPA